MQSRASTLVIVGVLAVFAAGIRARGAEASAKVDEGPVEQSVRDLQSSSADVREGGEVRLYCLRPEYFPAIEAASRRPDLSPGVVSRLKEVVDRVRPLLAARQRWNLARQAEADWNERTALAAYDAVGRKDPKWNDLARTGIRLYVSIKPGEGASAARGSFEKAIALGCNDPLVLYFEARCVARLGSADPLSLNRFYRVAAQAMEASNYPPVRKCMAMAKYVDFLLSPGSAFFAPGRQIPPQVVQDLNHFIPAAGNELEDAFAEPNVPATFVSDPAEILLKATGNMRQDEEVNFKHVYDAFRKAFPASVAPLVFKGKFYTGYAWEGRGTAFANQVTEQQWKLFRERLAVAEKALTRAYELDPNDPDAPAEMITVAMGQGKGRDAMEMWFKRAMKANPDNYDACMNKLNYLQPKWFGTPQEMIAFGRDCAASKNWYGRIPFILSEAHGLLAKSAKNLEAYYHTPDVWPDIASAYKPYLNAWPDDAWDRSRLCYYACLCGQWAQARHQFQILGAKAVPDQFGGEQEMQKLRQRAMSEGNSAP